MTDQEAIAAIEDRIRAAYGVGDADGVANQYTEDALLLRPGSPTTVGREAIAQIYRNFFTNFRGDLMQEIEEIVVFGDQAYLRGKINVEVTPKQGGKPTRLKGKYLAVAQRCPDGLWRFTRDIYNYDHHIGGRPSILGAILGMFRR